MNAKKNLVIDAVALAVYALTANPALTGITLHEWVSLGLFVVFVVHLAAHGDWVVEATRSVVRPPSFSRVGNLVLDSALVITFLVCCVSGTLISGAVLPAFGYYAQGYYFWDPLHVISAKLLFALLLVHLVVHGKWLVGMLVKKNGAQDECDSKH